MPNPTRPRWRRATGTISIVLAWLSFTYMPHLGFWLAPLGALVIVWIAHWTWGAAGLGRIGLVKRRGAFAGSAAFLVAIGLISWLFIGGIARMGGVDFVCAPPGGSVLPRLLHTAGQTGSEEIVLGALLLGWITRAFPRVHRLVVAVVVAAAFAALHYAFYAFRPVGTWNHGQLSILALLALFAAGVVRNCLILASGHIGFAWAAHLAWNFFFMGGSFVAQATGQRLDEPERFNLVLGHPTVAWMFGAAAVATAIQLLRPREADA